MIDNSTTKKVSIIVPIYNVEHYLQECIDSIVCQTHNNIEIILVDDGSPDKSGIIADNNALEDERIKVIHKKNGGVSSARNAGLAAITGDYFCFADADDKLEPNYIEYLLRLAIDNQADISITTELFTTFNKTSISNDYIQIVNGKEAACLILCYRMPIGVYCKLFSKDILNKGAHFEESLFIGEGFNFNVDAFILADKVAVGHKRVYFYRRDNEDSAMTRFNINKIRCALTAIDYIENKHKELDIYFKRCVQFARWHTSCDMLSFMTNANAHKNYPNEYEQCRQKARKDAFVAFKVNTSSRERFKSLITFIYPNTLAYLIKWRGNLYKRLKNK